MTETRTYGDAADLALDTFVKLVRAFSTIARLEGAHIRSDYGLTPPQFGVLDALGHLGAMTMGELCRKRLVTGGNMTVVVDNLEEAGIVRRRPSPEDRRSTIVDLTREGRRRFDRIFPHHAQSMARMFSVLDASEQRQLGRLLKKLGRALAESGVPEEVRP
jgi:MarR family 2-MHQ and catechol resistance regulon transcriptional repressor